MALQEGLLILQRVLQALLNVDVMLTPMRVSAKLDDQDDEGSEGKTLCLITKSGKCAC